MKLGEVTVTSLLGNYSPGTVRALTNKAIQIQRKKLSE